MRQVVQPADQPTQVTAPVAVRIAEQVHLHAIDDRFPVPTIRHVLTLLALVRLDSAVDTPPIGAVGRGGRVPPARARSGVFLEPPWFGGSGRVCATAAPATSAR